MGNVVNLHDERWIEGVFDEAGLRVDVSTKGNVRFQVDQGSTHAGVLTMEQVHELAIALSTAYKEDDDDG